MSIVSKTPVPLRLPFVRGEEVHRLDLGSGLTTPDRVRQVVNVEVSGGQKIRYYALDSSPGLLTPADRLSHEWEIAPLAEEKALVAA